MSIVLSIVPRLPPKTDGVGDYALFLAREFRHKFNLETEFLVCDTSWTGQSQIEGFHVYKLDRTTTSSLLGFLKQDRFIHTKILLHYVGYGYAKWGDPDWLIDALSTWKSQSPKTKLITMFHELYAFPGNKPWKHNFWNSHKQKNLAKQLARLSDETLTSGQSYAETIDHFRGISESKPKKTPFFPVFSTVGEPQDLLPWEERSPHLIIFGQALNKRRAYEESAQAIQTICDEFSIHSIIDVGPKTGLNLDKLGDIPVREAGKCSIEEISTIFQNAKLGFFNYNPDYLAKSTIFAAYCAYGLLPVSPFKSCQTTDGLTPGEQYWVIGETEMEGSSMPPTIAHNAHSWYRTHSLEAQAHHFVKLLHTD